MRNVKNAIKEKRFTISPQLLKERTNYCMGVDIPTIPDEDIECLMTKYGISVKDFCKKTTKGNYEPDSDDDTDQFADKVYPKSLLFDYKSTDGDKRNYFGYLMNDDNPYAQICYKGDDIITDASSPPPSPVSSPVSLSYLRERGIIDHNLPMESPRSSDSSVYSSRSSS